MIKNTPILLFLCISLISCQIRDKQDSNDPVIIDSKSIYGPEDNRTIPHDHNDLKLKEIAKSVVVLTRRDKLPIKKGFCSGTIISNNGFEYLITAGHCMKGYDDCDFNIVSNFEENNPKKQVLIQCEKILFHGKAAPDMAIVKLKNIKDNIPALEFNLSEAKKGSALAVIGHPEGLEKRITDDCFVEKDPTNVLTHQCDTFSGNSGSITVNRDDYGFSGILISGRKDRTLSGKLIRYKKGYERSTNVFHYRSIIEDIFAGRPVKSVFINKRHFYNYTEAFNIKCSEEVDFQICKDLSIEINSYLNDEFAKNFEKTLDLKTINISTKTDFIKDSLISANLTIEEIKELILARKDNVIKERKAALAESSRIMQDAMILQFKEQNGIRVQCGFSITDKEACQKTIDLIVDILKKNPLVNAKLLDAITIYIGDKWAKSYSIEVPLGVSAKEIERRIFLATHGETFITAFEASGIKFDMNGFFGLQYNVKDNYLEILEKIFKENPEFDSISLDLKTIKLATFSLYNYETLTSMTISNTMSYEDILFKLKERFSPQFKRNKRQ